MTTKEHILTVLAEECGEVAKEVCKALRFGPEDQVTLDPLGPRGTEGPTNKEKIGAEMIDLLAVYQMAVAQGLAPDLGFSTEFPTVIARANAKQKRVWDYIEYAWKVGALRDFPNTKENSHD